MSELVKKEILQEDSGFSISSTSAICPSVADDEDLLYKASLLSEVYFFFIFLFSLG